MMVDVAAFNAEMRREMKARKAAKTLKGIDRVVREGRRSQKRLEGDWGVWRCLRVRLLERPLVCCVRPGLR